jgi:hypothetical protein
MDTAEQWYQGIESQINSYRQLVSKKDFKKYQLDLLLRVAKRLASFSRDCEECRKYLEDISRLSAEAGSPPLISKEQKKEYNHSLNTIVQHLKKKHKLVFEGETSGYWIAIGVALGIALGPAFNNLSWGIPIGLAIGVAIGSGFEYKAKKEGRVL